MVNNYSVFKRRRKRDEYSPGGETGRRPDRAGDRIQQPGEGGLSRSSGDHRRY